MAKETKYLSSEKVKVYPCAYRGQQTGTSTSKYYNPESRIQSENNISTRMRDIASKQNFCISYIDNVVQCVIHGYKFILDLSGIELTWDNVWAIIKVGKNTTHMVADDNTDYDEIILKPLEAGTTVLDKQIGTEDKFIGLKLSDTIDNNLTSFRILTKDGTDGTVYKIPEDSKLKLLSNEISDVDTEGQTDVTPKSIYEHFTTTDSEVNNELKVGGINIFNKNSSEIGSELTVKENATFEKEVTVGEKLNAKGGIGSTNVDLTGKLTTENADVNNVLEVNKDSKLFSINATDTTRAFSITNTGNAKFNGTLDVTGKSTLKATEATDVTVTKSLTTNSDTTTTINGGLTVKGSSSFTGTATFSNQVTINNSLTTDTLTVNNNTTLTGAVTVKSSLTATETIKAQKFNATSDRRLKENITPYNTSIPSILDLPVYKYDFIEGEKGQIGCMAQDLKEICPEIVQEDEKGFLSIQESKIVYLLLEEVKKLTTKVEGLTSEIEKLKKGE